MPHLSSWDILSCNQTNLIDVVVGELFMRVNDEQVIFNIFKAMKYPELTDDCFVVNVIHRAMIKCKRSINHQTF